MSFLKLPDAPTTNKRICFWHSVKTQYDATLAITGVVTGTFRKKLYAELGLESLKFRRWFRKLAFSHSRIHLFQMSQTNGLS